MILNDLESPKRWFCGIFFTIEYNLHMKFSALNVDFSTPSPDPLGLRRPV